MNIDLKTFVEEYQEISNMCKEIVDIIYKHDTEKAKEENRKAYADSFDRIYVDEFNQIVIEIGCSCCGEYESSTLIIPLDILQQGVDASVKYIFDEREKDRLEFEERQKKMIEESQIKIEEQERKTYERLKKKYEGEQ